MCLLPFFINLSVVHGAFASAFCLLASPSIKYSIFLNTISMKMVCGQVHPHQSLPNTEVNKTMNTTKVNMVSPNRKKSCGQNTSPKMMNFRSITFNNNKGLPFTSMNGMPNKRTRQIMLTHVRAL